jgi:hypothetical protein
VTTTAGISTEMAQENCQQEALNTTSDPNIREPDQIRQDCARKLRAVQISSHFQAILGCLLGEVFDLASHDRDEDHA